MKIIYIKSKKHGIKEVLVDDEDYNRVNEFKWHILYDKDNPDYYCVFRRNKGVTEYLHRFVMNAKKGEMIDHRDCNPLNNQKHNLRFATCSQNQMNKKSRENSTSKYKGVWLYFKKSCFIKKDKTVSSKVYKYWYSGISYNKKHIFLGMFKDEIKAALAYNEAAKKYHGEFALLNIIS